MCLGVQCKNFISVSVRCLSKQQILHEQYLQLQDWSDYDLCCCLHILQPHDQPWSHDTLRKMIISIWSKFDLRSHIPIKSITRAALGFVADLQSWLGLSRCGVIYGLRRQLPGSKSGDSSKIHFRSIKDKFLIETPYLSRYLWWLL